MPAALTPVCPCPPVAAACAAGEAGSSKQAAGEAAAAQQQGDGGGGDGEAAEDEDEEDEGERTPEKVGNPGMGGSVLGGRSGANRGPGGAWWRRCPGRLGSSRPRRSRSTSQAVTNAQPPHVVCSLSPRHSVQAEDECRGPAASWPPASPAARSPCSAHLASLPPCPPLLLQAEDEYLGPSAGCTAVTALVRNGELFVANAGDSRCVLSRAGTCVWRRPGAGSGGCGWGGRAACGGGPAARLELRWSGRRSGAAARRSCAGRGHAPVPRSPPDCCTPPARVRPPAPAAAARWP